MIIIWSGYGFLAVLIPVVIAFGGNALLDMVFGDGWSAAGHQAVTAVLLFISAGIVWVVGERLNKTPGRVLLDEKTGQRVTLKRRHTLFWIPMQWMSTVIAAIGLIQLVK